MNSATQARRPTHPLNGHSGTPRVDSGYDELSQPEPIVEHQTIPGFLRRIPHRWHLDDINRFGDKVGRAAESMQLAYLSTVDRSLGVIRIFPVPLLQRIYEIMSVQFNWPKIIEAEPPALADTRKITEETVRAHERVGKHLRALLEVTRNSEVQHSIAVVIQWIEQDLTRLREEMKECAAPEAR